MADRDEVIADRLAHNLDDVMKNGPRLALGRSTWIVARCPNGPHVLKGGLGGMGVGQMWVTEHNDGWENPEKYADNLDPTYAEAPMRDGCEVCQPTDWANWSWPSLKGDG